VEKISATELDSKIFIHERIAQMPHDDKVGKIAQQ